MSRRLLSNKFALLALILSGVVLGLASSSTAKMYKWVDDQGKVHYTNSPSKIPRKFRKGGDGVKTMKSSRPSRSSSASSSSSGSTTSSSYRSPATMAAPMVEEYRYDLEPAGNNHFMVPLQINGNVQLKLLLDTGASMVVLHPSVAGALGIQSLEEQPAVKMSTAGGVELNPLVTLDEVRLGHIVAYDVVAALNSHMDPQGGLLGMSFLSNFKWSIDNHRKQLVLEPMYYPGDTLYGDKPLSWWQEKYKKYVTEVNRANYIIKKANPRNPANRLGILQQKRLVLFYRDLVERLDRRADAARLPEKYRDPFPKN